MNSKRDLAHCWWHRATGRWFGVFNRHFAVDTWYRRRCLHLDRSVVSVEGTRVLGGKHFDMPRTQLIG